MLFNTTVDIDFLSIIQFLNDLSTSIGITDLAVDTPAIYRTCVNMREDFPCQHGIENASVFKKSAIFVLQFLDQNPLEKDGFSNSQLPDDLKIKDPNTIVALYIALLNITGARIFRTDGKVLTVSEPIFLSRHSFLDILEMLHERNFHFMTLSLLLEQITYKTNPEVQYSHKGITIGALRDSSQKGLEETLYLNEIKQNESDTFFTIEGETSGNSEPLSQDDVIARFDNLEPTPQYDQIGYNSPENNPNY